MKTTVPNKSGKETNKPNRGLGFCFLFCFSFTDEP